MHNCLQEQKTTPRKYIWVYELYFCLGLLGFDLPKKKKICLDKLSGDFLFPLHSFSPRIKSNVNLVLVALLFPVVIDHKD